MINNNNNYQINIQIKKKITGKHIQSSAIQ